MLYHKWLDGLDPNDSTEAQITEVKLWVRMSEVTEANSGASESGM